MRKSWDSYFMGLAYDVSERATCTRRNVGAVIVKDNRIISTGYNGSPAGLPHCIDDGCHLENGHCIRCIHAEANAIMECAPLERKGATIYITDYPCQNCAKLIINSGISKVIYDRGYDVEIDWFKLAPWIKVIKYTENI